MRVRLDAALVKRGLADSRTDASRMIDAGNVTVSGTFATKASRMVGDDEPIRVVVEKRFVSRGGEKLEHALDAFGISVVGRSVLDAGVSTGGFTDCVLQKGASRVFAVDVGRNQLHEKIKSHPLVEWRDGVNVRDMSRAEMQFPCSLVVADLSFISLSKVLTALHECITADSGFPTAEMLLLVKPQFEAGRVEVSRGKGVITDPLVHAQACDGVKQALRALGADVMGTVESPIKGAEGNTEFIMWAKCPTRSVG